MVDEGGDQNNPDFFSLYCVPYGALILKSLFHVCLAQNISMCLYCGTFYGEDIKMHSMCVDPEPDGWILDIYVVFLCE